MEKSPIFSIFDTERLKIIDSIIQMETRIIPVEVKSATNLKAKSLSVYREKIKPKTEIRASLADYKKTNSKK